MTMPIAHDFAPKRSTSSFAFMVRESGARILWSLYMSARSFAIFRCSGVSIRPLPSLSTMAPPSERIIGIVNDTGLGVAAALSSMPKPHWLGRPVPRVSFVSALPTRIASSHVLGGSVTPASLRSGLLYPRPVEVRYTGMATILPFTEHASRRTAWLKSSHSSYLNCPRSATKPALASGWLSWLCAPTTRVGCRPGMRR